MISRRAFVANLTGSLLAAPLAAEAQQAANVARIGYLAGRLADSNNMTEAFREGLRDLGYAKGMLLGTAHYALRR